MQNIVCGLASRVGIKAKRKESKNNGLYAIRVVSSLSGLYPPPPKKNIYIYF
jgi:hypothetical protein